MGADVSQRESGYERKERDLYETPAWVTLALWGHLRDLPVVWEPACGSGKMVGALCDLKFPMIIPTDIVTGTDFLKCTTRRGADAIITNPPYALAREFIEHALELMRPHGLVAMLLRTDYDHAATRQHLFSKCPQFAKKIVLTRRIVWFDGPKAAPSFNHAWYIWDWKNEGAPTLAYAP